MKRVASVCWVALLWVGIVVFAGQATELLTSVSPTQIRALLQEMELEFEQTPDEDGDPVWRFLYQRILVTMVPYDRQVDGRFGSLLFYAGWTTTSAFPVDAINAWNRGARFGRAYVDAQGDPVIELDLLLTGGIAMGTIPSYIDVFTASALDLEAIIR